MKNGDAMTFLSRLTFGILLAASVTIGCSGDGTSSTPGTGGSTGGTTGTGGGGGTTGSGGGGTTGGGGGTGATFMAMIPCPDEASYSTSGNTIAFGGTDPGSNYAPKCLKVSAGTTVTFNGDNFAFHNLAPSTLRGTVTGNPITATTTGASKAFTFPNPGFYAYFCTFHGSDSAEFMNGVIWVQ
jgi:plastocyanin